MHKQVKIYRSVLPALEIVTDWFYNALGVRLSRPQAVNYCIATLVTVDAANLSIFKSIINIIDEYVTTRVREDLVDMLKGLLRQEGMGYSINFLVNAIIYERAMTLDKHKFRLPQMKVKHLAPKKTLVFNGEKYREAFDLLEDKGA